MGAQPLRHGDGIARGLQHHLIIRPQLSRKGINMLVRDLHPAPAADHAILEHRHIGKGVVNVQSDDSHNPTPSVLVDETGAGGQHDTYSSALAAHPGKSQGAAKKLTRARSSWSSERPARTPRPPGAPVPDGRTIRLRPRQVAGITGHRDFHTGYEPARTAVPRGAAPAQDHPQRLRPEGRPEAHVRHPHPRQQTLAQHIRVTEFERRQMHAIRRELDEAYEAETGLKTKPSNDAPQAEISSSSRT